MASRSGLPGLTGALKERLIQETLKRRLEKAERAGQAAETANGSVPTRPTRVDPCAPIPQGWTRFDQHPGYQQLRIIRSGARQLGIQDPFFRVHEGTAGAMTLVDGRRLINFSSYNYLDLCGHPAVNEAAKRAIDRYGTSASASRLVAGERPVHQDLERALARAYEVDDCVVFVSGHATNVSTIGHLFGAKDLVLHDALIHNSVLQGIQLSGARRMAFPHNDVDALDELLSKYRRQFERVLIVVEGIYSMDGDMPDLPRFVDLKQRHSAFLMVDEAHSLGVLGASGLGIREQFGVAGKDVDIWMGTLSKALVEHLKCAAPGFVYSVGLPPPVAAAALAALEVMRAEPQRVATLRDRGALFLELARRAGIDTGTSAGYSVIPAIAGSSIKAVRLSDALFARGINVQPILYPAVPERSARLRFFISCAHQEDQIRDAVNALASEMNG
jgi:8-amino-7-oxononanoate synthase